MITLLAQPHVTGASSVIEVERDHIATVWVVETDLILNANDPRYEKDAVDALLYTIQERVLSSQFIQRVRVVQAPGISQTWPLEPKDRPPA